MTKIEMLGGRPAITVGGEVLPPSFATVRTRDNGGQDIHFDPAYFESLGEAGIRVFFLHCNTLWLQPNAIELFDKEARALFAAVPDAYVLPRIGLHPPIEWIKAHPEECVTYSDGSRPPFHLFTESYEADLPMMYSLASSLWREAASEALAEVWKKLMALPYADRIIGCFPAAGATSEWYSGLPYIDVDNKRVQGYSDAVKREFSLYLRETYGTDEALRRAWGDDGASIENPKIPTYEEHYFGMEVDYDAAIPKQKMLSNAQTPPAIRNGTHIGAFTDMNTCPHVYDFYRAHHKATARAQQQFARVIKSITPDRIVGMCYGSQGCDNTLTSGRNGYVSMLLDTPEYDFMLNPSVYQNRQPGGAPAQRVAEDSFALHGKIYISQEDTRTHAENRYFRRKYNVYDSADAVNAMKREFGKNISCDNYSWWFDQLLGGRRYRFPEIYDLIGRQQEIAKEAYTLDRNKETDVAFVFCERSTQLTSIQTTGEIVELLRNYELPYIGVRYSQYYVSDITDARIPPHKLYVFVNCFVLTAAERKKIKARLAREGAVALWLYASGFADPSAAKEKMSAANISDLTGIQIAMENDCFDPVFRFSGKAHPATEGLDRRALFGIFQRHNYFGIGPYHYSHFESYLYPLFHSVDPDATDLAYFANTGYPAVSLKKCDGYTSIFYGAKLIDRSVLRAIAKYAGAHVYSADEDVIFVGKNYITHHAASSGKKTLSLPAPSRVTEVYENRVYAENATNFSFDSEFGETKMFRIEPI